MMIFAGADLIKSALNHALGQREWTAGPPDDVRFSLFFHCFSLFFHCFFTVFSLSFTVFQIVDTELRRSCLRDQRSEIGIVEAVIEQEMTNFEQKPTNSGFTNDGLCILNAKNDGFSTKDDGFVGDEQMRRGDS